MALSDSKRFSGPFAPNINNHTRQEKQRLKSDQNCPKQFFTSMACCCIIGLKQREMTKRREPAVKAQELRKNDRLYSNVCGHRYWYFTGMTLNKTGYPNWGKVKRYRFEDVCGHTEDFTAEEIEKYFEKR